ncbi:MAG: prolipoprotein diacylglyceryl transferase [Rhodobacter sp.]|nr:prolipoprotein diacylglyceryl transferase [Rhodobacter sp.]
MLAAIPFPDISPEIFTIHLGEWAFSLRWYAMAYIVGILIGWRIGIRAAKSPQIWRGPAPMKPEQVEDFLTWIIIGIIAGGRLGYVLFYRPAFYAANPLDIFRVWDGGMAFHGGFLGVVLAVYAYSRRHDVALGSLADLLAICTPPGLLLGRLANFINAELWGRPTDAAWGVIFPGTAAQDCALVEGLCARHPSQLYEAGLEGVLLGGLLLFLAFRHGWLKRPWMLSGLFFAGYGLSRFLVEFVRQADPQFITPDNPLGHVIGTGGIGVSMGQLLSLPMILVGVSILIWARRRA